MPTIKTEKVEPSGEMYYKTDVIRQNLLKGFEDNTPLMQGI